MTPTDAHANPTAPSEARLNELETRFAFLEQALSEMSDALAATRLQLERHTRLVRVALEEFRQNQGSAYADAVDEPPPPHY